MRYSTLIRSFAFAGAVIAALAVPALAVAHGVAHGAAHAEEAHAHSHDDGFNDGGRPGAMHDGAISHRDDGKGHEHPEFDSRLPVRTDLPLPAVDRTQTFTSVAIAVARALPVSATAWAPSGPPRASPQQPRAPPLG